MPFQPFPLCSHFSCRIKWQYFLRSWDSIFSTWAVGWVPGLFIYLCSSDVWLQSPDQELCPKNCSSGLFFIVCCIITSKSTWPNCHATIYPQNLFTVLCSLSKKNHDLHLFVSRTAESYVQIFPNSSQKPSHSFSLLQNCIFKAIPWVYHFSSKHSFSVLNHLKFLFHSLTNWSSKPKSKQREISCARSLRVQIFQRSVELSSTDKRINLSELAPIFFSNIISDYLHRPRLSGVISLFISP